jgi:hypothetical protein
MCNKGNQFGLNLSEAQIKVKNLNKKKGCKDIMKCPNMKTRPIVYDINDEYAGAGAEAYCNCNK